MKIPDPLRTGFHYVEYTYMNCKQCAVYFTLESAQEAMVKMMKRGVECHGLHEWKPKLEILSIQKSQ
jgi:hypothetical protein